MRQVAMFRLLVLSVLFSACAFAQRDLATVLGIVTDPQGGTIPNAKVNIVEDATGLSYDVITDSNGEYIRPLIKPGIYTITVEVPGFKKGIQKALELTVRPRLPLPLTLPLGKFSQIIR